jgi:hypothetical protein
MFARQLSIVFFLIEDYLMCKLWVVFAAATACHRRAHDVQAK